MTLGRRLMGCLGIVAGLAIPALATASAPQIKTQAPGWYRIMVGDFEVTSLSDGTFEFPPLAKLLSHATPEQIQKGLADAFITEPVETSVNGFLINTGQKLVLVDTGAGKLFGPTLGRLLANLEASGYRPEQVDEIYITHFHGDHIGGLTADGQRVFPNATVRADRAESDYWLSQAKMDAAPEDRKDGFKEAMAMLDPYVAAGKFKPFEGEVELVPGITARPSHGHTPGHSVYIARSRGQELILWGDIMHVAALQFGDPSVRLNFDSDGTAAEAVRRGVFALAAKDHAWVAGAHLSFPGLGHIRATATGYVYVPGNYTRLHD